MRELGTTSPKLEEELAPSLLRRGGKKSQMENIFPRCVDRVTGRSFSPGVELALLGSLFQEDASVFNLYRTGNEADFAALLHQTSYPPVVVELLQGEVKRQSLMNTVRTISYCTHTGTHRHTGADLFDVQELFSLEGDGHARNGDVVIVTGAVVDVCADGKRNRFGLAREKKRQKCLKNTVAIISHKIL